MDKVKLPKYVAEAIEELREKKSTNWDIVYTFAWDTNNGYPDLVTFAHAKLDTLMKALVNGYEVEQSPEDKVREYYQHHYEFGNNTTNGLYGHKEDRIKFETVVEVLDLLNIKIEGVNA